MAESEVSLRIVARDEYSAPIGAATQSMGAFGQAAGRQSTQLRTLGTMARSSTFLLRAVGADGAASMVAMGTHTLSTIRHVQSLTRALRGAAAANAALGASSTFGAAVGGLGPIAARRGGGAGAGAFAQGALAARGGATAAAGAGAGAGAAALGSAGLVALAAAGLFAGYKIAERFDPKNRTPPAASTITNVNVSVDARGTATEHRLLADLVAREVESTVSTKSRYAGVD